MSQVIYRYTWKGIRTRWDYKLEIIPADNSLLNNPSIIDLPSGFLKSLQFNYKYDKFPLGFPETPTLSMTFDLNLIPSTPIYNELRRSFFDPLVIVTIPGFNAPIELGTLFVFSISNGEGYYPVFRGVYRSASKLKYELSNKTISIECLDLSRCILDSISFTLLPLYDSYLENMAQPPQPAETTTMVFDIVGTPCDVSHFTNDSLFHFRPHKFLFEFISYIGSFVKNFMIRSNNEPFDVPLLYFPKLYTQKEDGSGELGSALGENDIYHISYISLQETNQKIGGLYSNLDDNSLLNRYKNSVWDFFKEYSEWLFVRGRFTWFGVVWSPVFGTGQTYEVDIKNIKEIKEINLYSNIIKRATASLYEFYRDNDYSDIDRLESVKTGSYNETEITIPIVFNNIPSAVQYKALDSDWMKSFYPHITNLYYKSSSGVLIRVHEYCEWEIKNNVFSSSIPDCDFVPFSWLSLPKNKISELFMASQQQTGIPYWASKLALALFSHQKQTTLKASFPLEALTNFDTNEIPWLMPQINLKVDLQNIDGNVPINTDEWTIIDCLIDFNTETVDVELFSVLW